MEKLELTKIKLNELDQGLEDSKVISLWKVERRRKQLVAYIKANDYRCFALSLLRLKHNKNGTIPSNLNKAFRVDGAIEDIEQEKAYSHTHTSYFVYDNKYRINLNIKEYSWGKYLNVSISPCDSKGYTYGECYECSVKLEDNLTDDSFMDLCNKAIIDNRLAQKNYEQEIKNIEKVVKQLSKLNLYGINLTVVKEWLY